MSFAENYRRSLQTLHIADVHACLALDLTSETWMATYLPTLAKPTNLQPTAVLLRCSLQLEACHVGRPFAGRYIRRNHETAHRLTGKFSSLDKIAVYREGLAATYPLSKEGLPNSLEFRKASFLNPETRPPAGKLVALRAGPRGESERPPPRAGEKTRLGCAVGKKQKKVNGAWQQDAEQKGPSFGSGCLIPCIGAKLPA